MLFWHAEISVAGDLGFNGLGHGMLGRGKRCNSSNGLAGLCAFMATPEWLWVWLHVVGLVRRLRRTSEV
jgi:hypothetical protein